LGRSATKKHNNNINITIRIVFKRKYVHSNEVHVPKKWDPHSVDKQYV